MPRKKSQQSSPKPSTIETSDTDYLYKITLFDERPMSVNNIWSGIHWKKRSSEKNRIHRLIDSCFDGKDFPKIEQKVDIDFTCYMKVKGRAKLYDSDNVIIKPYIDSLRDKLLFDDTTVYVGRVSIEAVQDNENPRLEIIIRGRG